ncbi:rod-binding protein [Acuticoccus sp. MNP-M23]|uniref:rod-binding protein n=1 Tax=Acuticoccus sp. MNP-M23 TaxID=3072793 RepID=UPI0028165494|nr:rod-binding protein [Acuticoccus sp. MNP-M23]WMS41817.1 rod-binding protein [Acuticoccus sp. MNP-M23]
MIELSSLSPLAGAGALTPAQAANAPSAYSARPPGVTPSQTLGEKFEAAMMTPMIAAILPPDDSVVWGGSAGKMWRGLFAEEIATATASAGGFGIAQIIDRAIAEQTGSTQ